ncbi:MAG: hypothetical protein IIC69_03390 [Nanoarchaeota archaeon]|nr:hypothetical protein [Nanoarchaeota archaeon]
MSALWGYILGNLIWYVYEKHINGENFLIELGRCVYADICDLSSDKGKTEEDFKEEDLDLWGKVTSHSAVQDRIKTPKERMEQND